MDTKPTFGPSSIMGPSQPRERYDLTLLTAFALFSNHLINKSTPPRGPTRRRSGKKRGSDDFVKRFPTLSSLLGVKRESGSMDCGGTCPPKARRRRERGATPLWLIADQLFETPWSSVPLFSAEASCREVSLGSVSATRSSLRLLEHSYRHFLPYMLESEAVSSVISKRTVDFCGFSASPLGSPWGDVFFLGPVAEVGRCGFRPSNENRPDWVVKCRRATLLFKRVTPRIMRECWASVRRARVHPLAFSASPCSEFRFV